MKRTSLFVSLAAICFAGMFYLTSFKSPNRENSAKEYILVEIYEVPKYAKSGIYVHKGNNKTEYVPFKAFVADNQDENGELVLSTINKLTAEGYEITNTSSGLADSGMITKIKKRGINCHVS